MTEEYERGLRDGQQMIANQVSYLNDQVARVAQILTRAVFLHSIKTPPKPNTHVWLILGPDILTTGYYTGNGNYLADGGNYVAPTHWCMIPSAVSGDPPVNRRLV